MRAHDLFDSGSESRYNRFDNCCGCLIVRQDLQATAIKSGRVRLRGIGSFRRPRGRIPISMQRPGVRCRRGIKFTLEVLLP